MHEVVGSMKNWFSTQNLSNRFVRVTYQQPAGRLSAGVTALVNPFMDFDY